MESESELRNVAGCDYLVQVRAQVMTRDDSSGGWVPVGGGGMSFVELKAISGAALRARGTRGPGEAPRSGACSDDEENEEGDETGAKMVDKKVEGVGEKIAEVGGEGEAQEGEGEGGKEEEGADVKYVICGRKVLDDSVVLDCLLSKDLAYCKPNPTFHHWKLNRGRQRYGLTFHSSADAQSFQRIINLAAQKLREQSNEDEEEEGSIDDDDLSSISKSDLAGRGTGTSSLPASRARTPSPLSGRRVNCSSVAGTGRRTCTPSPRLSLHVLPTHPSAVVAAMNRRSNDYRSNDYHGNRHKQGSNVKSTYIDNSSSFQPFSCPHLDFNKRGGRNVKGYSSDRPPWATKLADYAYDSGKDSKATPSGSGDVYSGKFLEQRTKQDLGREDVLSREGVGFKSSEASGEVGVNSSKLGGDPWYVQFSRSRDSLKMEDTNDKSRYNCSSSNNNNSKLGECSDTNIRVDVVKHEYEYPNLPTDVASNWSSFVIPPATFKSEQNSAGGKNDAGKSLAVMKKTLKKGSAAVESADDVWQMRQDFKPSTSRGKTSVIMQTKSKSLYAEPSLSISKSSMDQNNKSTPSSKRKSDLGLLRVFPLRKKDPARECSPEMLPLDGLQAGSSSEGKIVPTSSAILYSSRTYVHGGRETTFGTKVTIGSSSEIRTEATPCISMPARRSRSCDVSEICGVVPNRLSPAHAVIALSDSHIDSSSCKKRSKSADKRARRKKESFGRRVRCRYCDEVFEIGRNRRGACPDAPDQTRTCIERVTCMCLARGALYHCVADNDGQYEPVCGCHVLSSSRRGSGSRGIGGSPASKSGEEEWVLQRRRNCKKWVILGTLGMFLPCLWCYMPLMACHDSAVKHGRSGPKHVEKLP